MFPLKDATEHDPTCGGYGFLDSTDNGVTFHPGIDFNALGPGDADLGAPVVAMALMTLEHTQRDELGYGLHQYWKIGEGLYDGAYVLYAHLSGVEHSIPGTTVTRGETVAACGNSGGWRGGHMWAHLHCEVFKEKPPFWGYWPKGRSRIEVEGMYHDPRTVAAYYDTWVSEPVMSEAEHSLIDAVREINIDAAEAEAIVRLVHGLGANHGSIEQWINEIGALKASLAEAQARFDPAAVDRDA